MKNIKKILIVLICTTIIISTITPSVRATSWIAYESLDILIHGFWDEGVRHNNTALIITGVAIEEEATQNERQFPITVTTINVTEVLYGDATIGEIIEVIANGHENPQIAEQRENEEVPSPPVGGDLPKGPFLEIGQEYLFFLHEAIEGRHRIGHPDRIYAIDSDGNVVDTGCYIVDFNPFEITCVDMIRQFLAELAPCPDCNTYPCECEPEPTSPPATEPPATTPSPDPNPPTGVILSIVSLLLAGGVALTSRKRK